MNIIPTIIDSNKEVPRDIFSSLLNNRIIFLNGEINDDVSSLIISELLYLDSINNNDISLYINSPGGSVTSGLAIYDTMKFIKSNVITIGMGLCASMGAFLLSSGDKRYALTNTEIMIHEVLSGINGKASDLINQTNHLIKVKDKVNKILAKNTKKSIKQIESDTKLDNYMDAYEAIKYHLIDDIIR